MNVRRILAKNYINFRGWRTNRKIVVIESDDWGGIRMANQDVVEKALKYRPSIEKNKFLLYDGLERQVDLENIFDLLVKHKDFKGNHPSITALTLTSNPNFQLIKEQGNNFDFVSELISDTYKKYGEDNLLSFWKSEGITNKLLYPQFHGKEHLFVNRYIDRINNEEDLEHFAFENNSLFGIENSTRKLNFLAAFEYQEESDKKVIEEQTVKGLQEFKNIFGFSSKSFCPSQSVFGKHIFSTLKDNGIVTIQAGQQFVPSENNLVKIDNIWGKRTEEGLIFTRRNCTYEPYKNINSDHVGECLKEIEIAFRWGKPAIINSHRINFSSRIRTDLRDKTLRDLDQIFTRIIAKWPEVEFMNSSELAQIMIEE